MSGSRYRRSNGKYFQRCFLSRELSIACGLFWILQMEVNVQCDCNMCHLNGGHVLGCTVTRMSRSVFRPDTTMTFTPIYISNRYIRQWQQRVASSQKNVVNIEIHYAVYTQMSFYGFQRRYLTSTCRCQEAVGKAFVRKTSLRNALPSAFQHR